MRKESVLIVAILFISLSMFLVLAEDNSTTNSTSNTTSSTTTSTSTTSTVNLSKIENGFACLETQVKTDCSGATNVMEVALTMLASPDNVVDECETRLNSFKKGDCFGTNSCNIKDTALAVLALEHVGEDTEVYENWLLNQTRTSTDIIWYLQQDSEGKTQCKITYNSQDYTFNVGENKKIDVSAGSCLSLAQSNYWYQVNPSCYDTDFSLACDQDFIASFLYKQPNSPTVYVLSDTKSAPANQPISLNVQSKCFGSSTCDYESSAWAVLALDKVGRDVKEFVPYLVAAEDSNKKYLPAAFLHMIVDYSEYGTKLIQQQKINNWEADNTAYNKYYDTALALLALSESSSAEVTRARDWLLNLAQEANGCWNNNNIRDTAMALWALERRGSTYIVPNSGGVTYCSEANFFCVAQGQCPTDQKLGNYYCTGVGKVCCQAENLRTCSEMLGTTCTGDTVCDGNVVKSGDSASCCLGSCVVKPVVDSGSCEAVGGYCRTSCGDNQISVSGKCDFSGDVCCKTDFSQNNNSSGGSKWWLWLLLIILIALIVWAILKRDKIKVWIHKKRTGYKEDGTSTKPGNVPPHGPSGLRRMPPRALAPRGMPPHRPMPSRQMPHSNAPQNKSSGDDIFNKLKEMSK